MHKKMVLLFFLFLCSCTSSGVYAPVSDISTIEPIPVNGTYQVMPGDTLYSIAWRYGLDYQSLAIRNHLISPYELHTGQTIFLRKFAPKSSNLSYVKQGPAWGHLDRGPLGPVTEWVWPARGPVMAQFGGLNKGINIGGHLGDPIYATASGKVVYSGNGLRGYGNLIIIKHNSTYLSAYAHNSVVYVKEGDWIRTGQKIAEMGKTGAPYTMLHFEIRSKGQPQNPLTYLSQN